MKFRPCIDLHHGQVKQIVGSTLSDSTKQSVTTNFETDRPAADYARMYQRDALTGGHVIMLGPGNEHAATAALQAYPKGLQVGGGINDTNAKEWIDKGASHVIVTSFVFRNGTIDMDRLERLVAAVGGKHHLVLDLSCRRKTPEGPYYVVTDRWQTYTDYPVTQDTLHTLSNYCDEFLVHGVDVEGMQCGILTDLVALLGDTSPIPVTYAGGARSIQDMQVVNRVGKGNVDLTIGSALDCFGGNLPYDEVVAWHNSQQQEQQQQEQQNE